MLHFMVAGLSLNVGQKMASLSSAKYGRVMRIREVGMGSWRFGGFFARAGVSLSEMSIIVQESRSSLYIYTRFVLLLRLVHAYVRTLAIQLSHVASPLLPSQPPFRSSPFGVS